uniref:NADH-ubiquinone oxidoreductase chain 3 n=1 Tax=Osborniella crotophagae TaxID=1912107 RepID=A0A7T1HEZ5_9NEOP|nr:NADH dehydrogenase subunit 3 [Osborniella crotophagae]
MMIIFYLLMSLMLTLMIFSISLFFMEDKPNESSESPFECGFEPISFSRIPFSMQFFSISIVFLIFDLEIVIILPLLKSMSTQVSFKIFMSFIILILILGLIIEWYDGSLNWTL